MIVCVFRRVKDAKELLEQWIDAFASEDLELDNNNNNNKFLERFKCEHDDGAGGKKTKLGALDMLKDLRILDIDDLKNRTISLLHKVGHPWVLRLTHASSYLTPPLSCCCCCVTC